MKTLLMLLFLPILLLAKNPFEKKLPFKEAIVEYSLAGNKKGVETLYIKEYGKQRVIYENTNSKIISKDKEQLKIITPKWTYTISKNSDIAKRVPNLNYLLYIRFKELKKDEQKKVLENLKIINYLPIQGSRFKIVRDHTSINNISCDLLIQKSKRECYSYKGSLLLKSEIKFLGFNNSKILTNIFKTKVDPKLFDISDYKMVDDKVKSVQEYEKSKKIIDFLKRNLNKKTIFIKAKNLHDYNQDIQEGIKALETIKQ